MNDVGFQPGPVTRPVGLETEFGVLRPGDAYANPVVLSTRVVEAYCITDEWIDLYDHKVRVEFVGFLRPQVKFDGPDQLVDELKRNVEETKRLTA